MSGPRWTKSLRQCELFDRLDEDEVLSLTAIAKPRSLRAGEYLFLLGDTADGLYVVVSGQVDLCFPLSFSGVIRDVTIESVTAGHMCGWSTFVKPHRFTLSARAAEATELSSFSRVQLLNVFDAAPRIGYVFTRKLSEIIGSRLLNLQALWARELQRTVAQGLGSTQGSPHSGVSE